MEQVNVANTSDFGNNESKEVVSKTNQHDALSENTILLPEPEGLSGIVEEEVKPPIHSVIITQDGLLSDEPTIDFKSSADSSQDDVLAEPLADAEKLAQAIHIDVKPIEDIIKLQVIGSGEKEGYNKRETRSSTRKSGTQLEIKPRPVGRPRGRYANKISKKRDSLKLIDKKQEEELPKEDGKDELDGSGTDVEEEQCRVCLSKDNLTSIFLFDETATIADKIMTICTTIKILEKDYLPQYICNNCLQSVNVAFNLKALCESTDKNLRSKLKRSKNKIRRPTEFVLIDCKDFSDESEEEIKLKDDDEFHISNESGNSEPDTDSDSSFDVNKKKNRKTVRRRRSAGIRRRGRLPGVVGKRGRPPKNKNIEVIPETRIDISTDDENAPPKKRRSKTKTDDGDTTAAESGKKREHPCVYCNQTFSSANALREHKRVHAGEKPFSCPVCSKPFKLLGSFNSHLRRHEDEDVLMCRQCEKHFPNKTEHRRHMVDVHGEPAAAFVCDKCKRAFTTKPRLDRHQDSKCPGFEITPGKKAKPEIDAIAMGKDLFKCVAPMTTTYWSDSFSD